MIVSATTDGGQAVASGKGHLGGVVKRVLELASSPTEAPPHRNDTNPLAAISPISGALSITKRARFDRVLDLAVALRSETANTAMPAFRF
jgi:hypothetical protein